MAIAILGSAVLPASSGSTKSAPTLGGTLLELNVGVFPADQVERFKRVFQRRVIFADGGFWTAIVILLLACLVSISFIRLGVKNFSLHLQWDTLWALFQICTGTAVGCLSLLIAVDMRMRFKESIWRKSVLSDLSDLREFNVPHEVVRDMRRIRNVLHADFVVESYSTDPFLWASYEDQRYCIAHWDEPGFVER